MRENALVIGMARLRESRGVAPAVAVAALVLMTLAASTGVYVSVMQETGPLMNEPHPQAGTQFTKLASQHAEVSLIADADKGDVYIRSPLGTETPLKQPGDTETALAFANGPTQVVVKTDDGEYVATSRTLEYGVDPDYVVSKDGEWDYTSVQEAVDNAPEGATIAVKRDIYEENIDITNSVNLVGETGTVITPDDTSEPAVTVSTGETTMQNLRVSGDGTGTGIQVTEEGAHIVGTRIDGLETGVALEKMCAVVQGNSITDSEEGVVVNGRTDGVLISENDLSGNENGVVNGQGDSDNEVNAQYNYWGDEDPDDSTSGNVDTSNELESFDGPFVVGDRMGDLDDYDAGYGNQCDGSMDDDDNTGGDSVIADDDDGNNGNGKGGK